MKMRNKLIVFLFLSLSLVIPLTSAVSFSDAGIRYSYPDSFGTGIAVSENGFWIPYATPNLTIGQTHTVKYYIDNKVANTTALNVEIILKLDSQIIADYSEDIIDSHTRTVNLDLSNLECNSSHTLYLEVKDSNSEDNNNLAQRNIIVSCGEPAPICGDSIKQSNEQCDNGEGNGVLCSAGYNEFCNYCSKQCELKTIKGEYCGDGIFNITYERCDDGNRIDQDGCSNECRKPFEVVTEDFKPIVWQCDYRIVYDDATEPGRISTDGQTLIERINDYAFEGEQVQWRVLVMDKNGIEKVKDVYSTVDGNIEANCERYEPSNLIFETVKDGNPNEIDPSCNARIDEEQITDFNPETMAYYLCTLTVETPDSQDGQFYGEKDVTVEAADLDGLTGTMAETESWFFNPVIQLAVDGSISFKNVRPGTSSYSSRVLVGNDADVGSGVILDMFISGTDFYDLANSGAKCPDTNQLSLSNFRYYATNGAYSTAQDLQAGRTCDSEGYCHINYGIGFNNPNPFYNKNEIIQTQKVGPYYTANLLSPGGEMSLIFRLDLPESCNGDFNTGQIYFWGEAV